MKEKKTRFRRTCLLLLPLILFSGCGPREVSQPEPSEIEIYYHADDGALHWGETGAGSSTEESASKERNPSEDIEKIVITLAAPGGIQGSKGEFTDLVEQFNKKNEKYQVELAEYDWNEMSGTVTRIGIEVGAGGGPDLLTEDVFPVSQEVIDSGILVDLTSYLEQSGITPENYFPGYASVVSDDRIYGVSMCLVTLGYCVDEKVLGDRKPPENMESLVDMLMEYTGQASFLGPETYGRYILAYFLEGSEDLWGIINWEEKTCDFTKPLFSKILELTKRYREGGKKGYEPVIRKYDVNMRMFPERSISLFCPGMIPIGFYFNDGPHYKYQVNGNTLMINANTEHLEGAYAFLSYVLSREGQEYSVESVNKEMWDSWYQYYRDLLELNPSNPDLPPVSEETRREVLEAYEDARFVPRQTEEILEIIYDAADGYIEGDQSREDVIAQIQNRVQLYLNEGD